MDKKKIRNIIIAFVVSVLLIGTLCGFGNYVKINDTYFISPHAYTGSDMYYYVDPETGVNYLVFKGKNGCNVCPRYNKDMTLYISEIDSKK